MKLFKRLLSTIVLLALVACGGGGGNSGTSPFGPGSGTDPGTGGSTGTPTAADLVLVLSAPAIASSGSETVTATATALDANRNAVAGVPISIRVDSNAIATPSGTVSGSGGSLTAGIGIGSDSSLRTITVTATSGSLTRTASLLVQSGTTAAGQASLALALDKSSISSAAPATVTVTLRDARGALMAGQVISFAVVRGLAATNVATALTRSDGTAVAFLAPASSTGAGADEVTATVTVGGSTLTAVQGFTVQATNVAISSFTSAVANLGAYGQTSLTVGLSGASIGSPVQVTVSSSCVTAGKAALSPTKFGATTASVTLQYRDIGCGAIQASDVIQVVIDGSASAQTLSLPIASPAVSSMAFISSTPEQIFVKGSGFTEASLVVFEVRDANGSPIPNVSVALKLLTLTGGVTMEGGTADLVRASDAQGRVTLRVNSGTQPTPVRISATIVNTAISTVSSNLSVAVGLPSQLNFSMSQTTRNIEGYNIDGTANAYQIIAADRSGNPVPVGTSINFVTEGGQIEAIKQTQLAGGLARTSANFVSAEPRPADGRVTVTAYALGEESFIDLNGNNIYDGPGTADPLVPAGGEPFQDLGNIFKDRSANGKFDANVDEFIPLAINNSAACSATTTPLLALDPSIPTVGRNVGEPATCDSRWSGAGQVYVRRAVETVFSTSTARPLWGNLGGLDNATCRGSTVTLQVGPEASQIATFVAMGGDTWYGARTGQFSIIVADANVLRLNPMAAGTTVAANTPTNGMTVRLGGGSPVVNTTEATGAVVSYQFTDPLITAGTVFVTFTSPSGTGTTVAVPVDTLKPPGFSACVLP
ncbi:exported hypothetical protein [Rubrivivax sp. A210]|uniref:hypothetical protein n=1 Tax=Rubrivivax sp. A210 TaxID=2772301 RepID=UPI0019190F66|nr:hypothetical protein [Rubrivivax sp. A210]CAD5372594.1 exported hypothetical protein [Rubrivivax sp. A210]